MDRSYFVKKYSDSTKKFSETDIINMLELLIESIFVIFVGRVFNRHLAYPCVQNMFLFLPTCSVIRVR